MRSMATKLLVASSLVATGSALNSIQLTTVTDELLAAIPEQTEGSLARGDMIGGMVRLPFHDAFGDGTTQDGCLGPNEDEHNGLEHVRAVVDPICADHAAYLSRADCWALAGNVAIVAAGGDEVQFRFGRKDCDDESAISDANQLPSANPDGNPWEHTLDVFQDRANISPREIVALMGAHSLGRVASDPDSNSGFSSLPWIRDTSGTVLSNRFFRDIAGVPWRMSTDIDGEWIHIPGPDQAPDALMLNTDMALVIDTSTCVPDGNRGTQFGGRADAEGNHPNPSNCEINEVPFASVKSFSDDNNLFKAEFSAAMQKLEELGYSEWELGAPISSTTLCAVTPSSSTKSCEGECTMEASEQFNVADKIAATRFPRDRSLNIGDTLTAASIEDCAALCVAEGLECKAVEYSARRTQCVLKSVFSDEVTTSIHTRFEVWDRENFCNTN